jgi:hypothetical protein
MNKADTLRQIKIVYYVFLVPDSDWKKIVSGQLTQLKDYGILAEADLFVHICDCYQLGAQAESLIALITPEAKVTFSTNNMHEYPGIKLVHELAKRYTDAIFIYFHAKGISHRIRQRQAREVKLFSLTFSNWRETIKLFNDKQVQKIGLFPAMLKAGCDGHGDLGGWIWYNYWYATGTYLSECPPPRMHQEKYYYEGWLGLHNKGNTFIAGDCHSLYGETSGMYFSAEQADHYLNGMTTSRSGSLNQLSRGWSGPALSRLTYFLKQFRKVLFTRRKEV